MLERIDHLICVVPDIAVASAAYEILGLVLTPEARHPETGAANRAIFVGTGAENSCYLELLSVFDEAAATRSGRRHYLEALSRGGGMAGIGFGVSDAAVACAQLATRGCPAPLQSIHRDDGSLVCNVAWVETGEALPFRISVIAYPEGWDARFERSRKAGRFAHTFPLKRLDHLAAVAPDIEADTAFWSNTLGVTVTGEIRTPAMVIRQLEVGDAVFELLGPASAESPFAGRPASLASMAAWEVDGSLQAAVDLARSRGFTCSDPEDGVIPHTRRASIPAAELGGVGMQLLEYV